MTDREDKHAYNHTMQNSTNRKSEIIDGIFSRPRSPEQTAGAGKSLIELAEGYCTVNTLSV